jgi:hypothetical protein
VWYLSSSQLKVRDTLRTRFWDTLTGDVQAFVAHAWCVSPFKCYTSSAAEAIEQLKQGQETLTSHQKVSYINAAPDKLSMRQAVV